MSQVSLPYLYEGHQKAQTGGKPKGSCSSVVAQQILPGLLPEPRAQENHIAEGQVVQTLYRVMDGISFNMPTAATMFFHERSSTLRSYVQKTFLCVLGVIATLRMLL